MSHLFQKHQSALNKAIDAIQNRYFYCHHPEHHNAYPKEQAQMGYDAFEAKRNQAFTELKQTGGTAWIGEEESPFEQKSLGISYPQTPIGVLTSNAQTAFKTWRKTPIEVRAGILMESIERISQRYFEIAYSTQHTTGQSFGMSFQASGPHATDRAVEAIAMAYQELTRFPSQVTWRKPMGRTTVSLQKNFVPIPKGIGLLIGCSTFPVWNSISGLYANLTVGNVAILKPHPRGVLPIAIYIAELQQVLEENGFSANIVQLAMDSSTNLISKKLAEHPVIRLIDFTGSSEFGNYIESLQNPQKEIFTEKAGINSVIIDSASNLRNVMRNLAFSVSLYSGQMCTAPQNIFIPETGVREGEEIITYEQVVDLLQNEVAAHVLNKRMKVTLGTIQSGKTFQRALGAKNMEGKVLLQPPKVKYERFPNARTLSPRIVEVDATQLEVFEKEWFGPVVLVVKTKNTQQSIELAQSLAANYGAISCAAYSTDEQVMETIVEEMNSAFTPVSMNLTGFIFVNQAAAFSDFHVSGGNPAGNASFADPNFINRRFVWVGNRKPKN